METLVDSSLADFNFYKGKRVFITGHTGFKGSYLCKILSLYGAKCFGYALKPSTTPSLFDIAQIGECVRSYIGDIRNFNNLKSAFDEVQPDVVFHLAAQPIVRESYKNPAYTYETNAMGTVNILECVRTSGCVKTFLNITTDKVYLNKEREKGYTEDEELDGYDPYSNSKSCSELITRSYCRSFFTDKNGLPVIPVSTARAGNVIGGGDFSVDRIIPDCVRAAEKNQTIIVRNPYSVRPYQHVLEPLYAYLLIAQKQFENPSLCGSYNIGPNDCDCVSTETLVKTFVNAWGEDLKYAIKPDGGPHEAKFLKLDCEKIKKTFGWQPRFTIKTAIEKVVEFEKHRLSDKDVSAVMNKQIKEFFDKK